MAVGRNDKIARKYARALFEATSPGELEQLGATLAILESVWDESKEFREIMAEPTLSTQRREELLHLILSQLGSNNPKLHALLALLFEHGRLPLLPVVASTFSALVDEMRRVLTLEITTAGGLSEHEKNEILASLRSDFGALATVIWSEDSSLIGGMVVRCGDKLLDGSIRGALGKVRQALFA